MKIFEKTGRVAATPEPARRKSLKGTSTGTGLIALGALLFAAAVVLVLMYHAGQSTTVNNFGNPNQVLQTPANSLLCSGSSIAPKLQLFAWITNLNSSVGAPTQIATPYQVFPAGSALSIASGTTSASAATNVSGINCGAQYTVFFGSNVGVYVAAAPVTVTSTVQSVSQKLVQISVPTMDFNNNSVAGFKSTGGVLTGVANNYVDSALTQRIKTSYGFYGPALLIYAYNSTQITSITPPSGFATATVPQGLVSAPMGYAVAGFSVPQLGANNITSFSPVIKTGTLPANTLIASTLHTWIASEGNQQVNGALETGLYINATKVNSPLVTVSGEYNISVYG